MPLPRKYLSFNQIKQYLNCPRQYYFSYIKEIRTPVNDKIFLGILFHSVAEFIIKRKIEGNVPEYSEIIEFFHNKAEYLKKSMNIEWDGNEVKAEKRGKAFTRLFYRDILPQISPIMAEKEMSASLPGTDTPLKGVIDLVEDDFSITDFKTTTSKWSQSRAKESFLQLYIYKYLFEKNMEGTEINELKFRILFSKNDTNTRMQEFRIKPEDSNVEKMFSIIKNVEAGISSGIFNKNEGYICNMCSFKDICKNSPESV